MTLWLSNLAAFSVQLAALVGTGAVVVAMLRVVAPRATLRFWQAVFAVSVAWPAYQLWADGASRGLESPGLLSDVLSAGLQWTTAPSGAAGVQAGIAAIGTDLATLVVVVLAIGAGLRVARLGVGVIGLRSIRAASQPADSLSSVSGPLQRQLGVTADIRFSDEVDSPATIGARRPVVLLPRRVRELPAPLQRAVLCHELIHVRRGDWLQTLAEELWCAVLWFHPAARVLTSRLSLARETLVDEATVAHTRDRRNYAATLLEFSIARPRLVGATAFIGRRDLERRIALVAQEVSMSRSSLVVRWTVAAAAVAIATLATSSNVPISTTLQAQAGKVYRPPEDAGVSLPRVITEVKPVYTPEAMQARVQGTVWMDVVVLASGDVGTIMVTRSLDTEHGLDQQAIDATRQWKFEPGTREGKAVAVEITIEMRFTLK